MTDWLPLLINLSPIPDALIKITLVFLIGWAFHFALRDSNPRWRVMLWRTVVVGVIAIPLVGFLAPQFAVPVSIRERSPSAVPQAGMDEPVAVRNDSIPPRYAAEGTTREIPHTLAPAQPPLNERTSIPIGRITVGMDQSKPIPSILRLDWRRSLLVSWGTVLLILILRFSFATSRISRLIRSAQCAPEEIQILAKRVSEGLGLKKEIVRVRISANTQVPFLVGLWKPTILLPAKVITHEYRSELPAILSHEMAHVLSRDLGWMALVQIVQAFLWFHPLVWGIKRVHSSACEEVSDAIAAAYIGDPIKYSSTLSKVALDAVGGRMEATIIPMARTSRIRRRIEFLRERFYSIPLSRGKVLTSFLLAILFVGAIAGLKVVYADNGVDEPVAIAKNTENSTPPNPSPGIRVLHFPSDHSVGNLYYRLSTERRGVVSFDSAGLPLPNMEDDEGLAEYGDARGDVVVDSSAEVILSVDNEESINLTFLSNLGKNDLVGLHFYREDLSDDQLLHIKHLTGLEQLILGRFNKELPRLTSKGLESLANLVSLRGLDLSGTSVDDEGLVHLRNLKSLEVLDLSKTDVSDAGMAILRDLPSLHGLRLNETAITDEGLAHIAVVKGLEYLDLSETKVTSKGMAHLTGLPSLRILILYNTRIDDDCLPSLGKIQSLESLTVSSTDVSNTGLKLAQETMPNCFIKSHLPYRPGDTFKEDRWITLPEDRSIGKIYFGAPGSMEEWKGVKRFSIIPTAQGRIAIPDDKFVRLVIDPEVAMDLSWLSGVAVENILALDTHDPYDYPTGHPVPFDVEQIEQFTSLKELGLSQTNLTNGRLEKLVNLASLESLSLAGAAFDHGDLAHLASLKGLRSLNLNGTRLGDEDLSFLHEISDLEELDIEGTNVTDAGLTHLETCLKLKKLKLPKAITDVGLASLSKLKALEELDLSHTLISGASISYLGELVNLRKVKIDGTSLSDETLSKLPPLPKLEHLSLSETDVGGSGLTWLVGLSSLKELNLKETSVSDLGLSQIGNLNNLKDLNLEKTWVGDMGVKKLAPLRNLETLTLSSTRVTDEGILSLMGIDSLRHLYLFYTDTSTEVRLALQKANPELEIVWIQNRDTLPKERQGTATLKGVLIPSGGESTSGLMAQLWRSEGDNTFSLETRVESDGTFEFRNVPAGECTLTCRHEKTHWKNRLMFTPQRLVLKENETKTLEWTQDEGVIRGNVTGLDPRFKWSLMLTTSDPECAWHNVGNYINAIDLDQDRPYEIKGLAPGTYFLGLHYYYYPWIETVDLGDFNGEMVFEPTDLRCDGKTVVNKDFDVSLHELSGTVVDKKIGEPLEAIKVELVNDPVVNQSGQRSESRCFTDAQGRFAFPAVGAGNHRITLKAGWSVYRTFDPDYEASDIVDSNQERQRELDRLAERESIEEGIPPERAARFVEKVKQALKYPSKSFVVPMGNRETDLGPIPMEQSNAGIGVRVEVPSDAGESSVSVTAYKHVNGERLALDSQYRKVLDGSGELKLQPLEPGAYDLVFNGRRQTLEPKELGMKALAGIEVDENEIRGITVSLSPGIRTFLYCCPQTWESSAAIKSAWLKAGDGPSVQFESNLGFRAIYLTPGTYQFGVTLKDEKTETINFEVNEGIMDQAVRLKF